MAPEQQDPPLKTAGPGHALMQALLHATVTKATAPPTSPRGLVAKREALLALELAITAVDFAYQRGELDEFSTESVMSAVAFAREYIEPLPDLQLPIAGDTESFLRVYRASLREARAITDL